MKYLLIAAALNMQVVYADLGSCIEAANRLTAAGQEQVVCLPKGEDARLMEQASRLDMIVGKFVTLIQTLQQLEKENTNETERETYDSE